MTDTAPPPLHNTVRVVQGDLLRHPAAFICQQCNCKSKSALGLSKAVFSKFPHSDVYSARAKSSFPTSARPGTISVHGGPGTGQRGVINLFGQIQPGRPRPGGDSRADRLQYFADALAAVERKVADRSLRVGAAGMAFPYQIGCGLGGGHWPSYLQVLKDFAARVPFPVFVVSLSAVAGVPSTPAAAAPVPAPKPAAAPTFTRHPQLLVASVAALSPGHLALPLPYRLPPPRYGRTDEPWVSSLPRHIPDVLGNTIG